MLVQPFSPQATLQRPAKKDQAAPQETKNQSSLAMSAATGGNPFAGLQANPASMAQVSFKGLGQDVRILNQLGSKSPQAIQKEVIGFIRNPIGSPIGDVLSALHGGNSEKIMNAANRETAKNVATAIKNLYDKHPQFKSDFVNALVTNSAQEYKGDKQEYVEFLSPKIQVVVDAIYQLPLEKLELIFDSEADLRQQLAVRKEVVENTVRLAQERNVEL